VSGALVASRKRMDVMGFVWLAHGFGPRRLHVRWSYALGLARLAAMTAGFLVTFSVRGLAIKLGSSLPVFRESATRERWKIERKPLRG
jgi:uncharacterized membrane protein YeiH